MAHQNLKSLCLYCISLPKAGNGSSFQSLYMRLRVRKRDTWMMPFLINPLKSILHLKFMIGISVSSSIIYPIFQLFYTHIFAFFLNNKKSILLPKAFWEYLSQNINNNSKLLSVINVFFYLLLVF